MKKLKRKELDEHRALLQDAPFSEAAKRKKYFFSDKTTYSENPAMPPKKEFKYSDPIVMDHDHGFKPPFAGRSGKHATFEKYPKWKADPPGEPKQKKEEDPDAKPGFKSPHRYRSIPCTSVATNIRNLKSSFPTFFRSPAKR